MSREEQIERFIEQNGLKVLDYMGKPPAYREWERRDRAKKSLNRAGNKGQLGNGPKQGWFKRGEGCI